MNRTPSNQMIKSSVQRNTPKLFHSKMVKYVHFVVVIQLVLSWFKSHLKTTRFCRYNFATINQCVLYSCNFPFNSPFPIQIHVKLLEGRPGMKSKVTPTTVLDFTLARYLRLRFQGMHTTQQSVNGIQWMFDHDELKKRSFYSLRYIKIGARLDCNGHAQQPKQYNDDEVSMRSEKLSCRWLELQIEMDRLRS